MMKFIRRALILFLLAFPFTLSVQAQSFGTFTPYSQLGVGMPSPVSHLPAFMMGSVTAPLRSSAYVNFYNPASYSTLNNTLFQVGFEANTLKQSRGDLSQGGNLAFLNQIVLAVPIKKDKIGLAFGFTPYSQVKYTLTDLDTLKGQHDTIPVSYTYDGSGSVDRIFGGLGWKIYKGLSLGFNASVYLGNINKTKTSLYDPTFNTLNTRRTQNQRMADISFDFGIQYQFKIKKIDMTLGATYDLGKDMGIKNSTFITYFGDQTGDNPLGTDTLSYKQKIKIKLPQSIGFGLGVGKNEKWMVATDFKWTQWSAYRENGVAETLFRDAFRYSLGGEYTPFVQGKKGFFNRVTYRIGGRYNQSHLNPAGFGYTELGISFGLGLPLLTNALFDKKLSSVLNIGFEYSAMRNKNASSFTQQDLYRFVISVNLRDKWFLSRKYN